MYIVRNGRRTWITYPEQLPKNARQTKVATQPSFLSEGSRNCITHSACKSYNWVALHRLRAYVSTKFWEFTEVQASFGMGWMRGGGIFIYVLTRSVNLGQICLGHYPRGGTKDTVLLTIGRGAEGSISSENGRRAVTQHQRLSAFSLWQSSESCPAQSKKTSSKAFQSFLFFQKHARGGFFFF